MINQIQEIKTTIQSLNWHKIITYVIIICIVIVLSIVLGFYISNRINTSRLNALQAKYLTTQDKLIALSEDRGVALTQILKTQKEVEKLQQKNDIKVKEVGRSAYSQKINMPDTDVDYEWNKFMSGVRERNNKRR
jgi:hypothetical protein